MKLRYIHLSDLHLSHSNMKGDQWAAVALNQDIVTSSMLNTIQEIVENGEPIDFIIITGDLARHGKQKE